MYYRKGKYTTQKSFIFQNLLKKLNILIVLMKGTGIKSCLSFQSYRKKIKYKFKKLETFEIKSLLIMFLVLNLLQENLYSFLWDQKNYLSRNFNAKKYVLISLKKKDCWKLCSNIFIYSQNFGKLLLRAPNNLKLIKYWKSVFLMYLLIALWIALLHMFHSSFYYSSTALYSCYFQN